MKNLTFLVTRSPMLIVLLTMVLAMACSGQQGPPGPAGPPGPGGPAADKFVSMVTVRSVVDPVPGHENHQLAIVLPPDTSGRVYTGTLSYNATKPVDVVVLLPYNPPGSPSAPHGELETFDAGGQLLSFTNIPTGKFGTMPFSGAGLALHTLSGDPFEASASIRAIVEDQTETN